MLNASKLFFLLAALTVFGMATAEELVKPRKSADIDANACYAELDVSACRPMAEAGDARAQERLAFMYRNGKGVEEDDAESVAWLRKSAEQGYAPALIILSFRYRDGDGVAQDNVKSLQTLRQAALTSHPFAQLALGNRYLEGEGVAKDQVRGYAWWALAAMNGSDMAREGIELLSQVMSRKQVEEGKALAKELHAECLAVAARSGDDPSQ